MNLSVQALSILLTSLFFFSTDVLGSRITYESIGERVYFLEDADHQYSEDAIVSGDMDHMFERYHQSTPNFQSTKSAFWIRFDTDELNKRHNYIEVASAFLDTLHFYEVSKKRVLLKSVQTGDAYPFNSRELNIGNFVFRLIGSQGSIVYLKVTSLQPLFFPLRSGNLTDFITFEHDFDFIQGIYFGFMLLMFFYNLFVWFSTREKIYLVYVCYVVSITFFMSAVFGYLFEYFWPTAPIINEYVVISSAFTQIFSVIFSKMFLKTELLSNKINRGLDFYIYWGIVIIVLILLDFKLEALVLSQVGLLTLGILLLMSGIISYRKGYKPAKYYLMAWGALNAGFITAILESVNILEISVFLNPMQIGSGIEVMLLSFALGDKLKTLKEEKEYAQVEALEALQKNEKLIREQNVVLERSVTERTVELSETNAELTALTEELSTTLETVQMQSNIIEKAHDSIKASINYARRIQDAMLPNLENMKRNLKDIFVLYQPRDTVSGDFYWSQEKDNLLYIAACDCTGHGVPGGFLSMLGNEVLTEIFSLSNISDPKDILDIADKKITEILNQKLNRNMDGMDVSMVCIDKSKKELIYAGAKNPLVYVKNGEVFKVKGDTYSVGGNYKASCSGFTSHRISTVDTKFYLFSDGFQDQIGGNDNKKFMVKKFRELLKETTAQSMDEQHQNIKMKLDEWMNAGDKTVTQIDDILVIGFEV